MSDHIDVQLLGKNYSVSVNNDTKEPLTQAITYLNQKLNSIAQAMGNATPERVAMITALNLSYELILLKTPDALWIEDLQHKLAHLNRLIEEAMLPQEDLFPL